MDTYTATMIAEGVEPAEDFDEYVEAYQLLIDTGLVWQLQGFFGRNAMSLIEMGHCHLK